MYRYYVSREGNIVETDTDQDNALVSLIAPKEKDISDFSEHYGIPLSRVSAAEDVEEPSRWEMDEKGTYLIIDVPYFNEEGKYDTVPLLIILLEDRILTVCEKNTGFIKRFLTQNPNISLEDKIGFELRLLHSLSKEYQIDLKDIDRKRREVEGRIHTKTAEVDISTLHDLENSLVYFITSLKGCNVVLSLIKSSSTEKLPKPMKEIFKTVMIENQQAIEMATIYREILGSTRDLVSTEINLRLNQTMKRLTAFTVVLTLPMIVTGAFGMNMDLPLTDRSWAFSSIALGTIAVCAGITIMLKRKRIF